MPERELSEDELDHVELWDYILVFKCFCGCDVMLDDNDEDDDVAICSCCGRKWRADLRVFVTEEEGNGAG